MSSAGFQGIGTIGDEYNALASIIQNLLSGGIHTATLCQVLSVTNSGGVSPVGRVDLQPMVNQSGADGTFVPQGIIKSVPYFRLYGGTNAVIIDPQVGNIGLAIFCERDISSVIATKAQSNPGSGRQYNISDGLYINGFLGGATPTQYIQFNSDGITVFSPAKITVQATGDVDVVAGGNSNVTATGSASVTAGTTASISADDSITLSAPTITLDGNVSSTGTMKNNSVDIGGTHAHQVNNVQGGSSTIETTAPNV